MRWKGELFFFFFGREGVDICLYVLEGDYRLRRRTGSSCVRAELHAGDKVRVSKSVRMYHVPKSGKDGVDVKGMEGEVLAVVLEKDGVPLSFNRPVRVKFTDPKFTGHFEETELETIS